MQNQYIGYIYKYILINQFIFIIYIKFHESELHTQDKQSFVLYTHFIYVVQLIKWWRFEVINKIAKSLHRIL